MRFDYTEFRYRYFVLPEDSIFTCNIAKVNTKTYGNWKIF